jgi:hypothetical protein
LNAARGAFTDSLNVVGAISAGSALILALLAVFVIRDARLGDTSEDSESTGADSTVDDSSVDQRARS